MPDPNLQKELVTPQNEHQLEHHINHKLWWSAKSHA